MCNNPNLYLVNTNAYIKFGKNLLSGKEILMSIKGHNYVTKSVNL